MTFVPAPRVVSRASAPTLTVANTTAVPPQQVQQPQQQPPTPGPGPIAPLSARQRKQVYFQSAIFDANKQGTPAQSVYLPAHQSATMQQVQQHIQNVRPKDQVMPSASDLKVTANVGHSVIIWDTPSAPAASRPGEEGHGNGGQFVRFGEKGDHFHVVKANRDPGAIKREFSTLDWADKRCEVLRPLNQEFLTSRSRMDAAERKRQDLSSEVLGGNRRMEQSMTHPARDIRSVQELDMHHADSTLDRVVHALARTNQDPAGVDCFSPVTSPRMQQQQPQSPRSPSGGGLAAAAVAATGGGGGRQPPLQSRGNQEAPLSARDRRACQLGLSKSSQFVGGQSGPGCASGSSPRASNRPAEDIGRRRSDRNFSDIFADAPGQNPAPRSPKASTMTLGENEATIYRPHPSAVGKEHEGPTQVLPLTPRTFPPETAEAKLVKAQERACWDTRVGMDLGAEIARRRRDRLVAKEPSMQSPRREEHVHSPRGRGTHRVAEQTRAQTSSPLNKGGTYRQFFQNNNPADTARARKLSSLQSTGIF